MKFKFGKICHKAKIKMIYRLYFSCKHCTINFETVKQTLFIDIIRIILIDDLCISIECNFIIPIIQRFVFLLFWAKTIQIKPDYDK